MSKVNVFSVKFSKKQEFRLSKLKTSESTNPSDFEQFAVVSRCADFLK